MKITITGDEDPLSPAGFIRAAESHERSAEIFKSDTGKAMARGMAQALRACASLVAKRLKAESEGS